MQTDNSPRMYAFRKAYAVAITVTVWSAAAVAAILQRKQLGGLFRRAPKRSSSYVSWVENWSAVYPASEDYAGDTEVGSEGQAAPPL